MRPRLPVYLAASMTIFRISLLFAIPGAKALPLSTKLPTQEEWATGFNHWEWKNWQSRVCDESSWPSGSSIHPGSPSGISPSGRLCKSPADTTSSSVHVEAPSSPGIHPESTSGRAPTTPPSQTPVDATSPSVGVGKLPSEHKDASLIQGVSLQDPTDASRVSVVALETSKWLEYLSRHAKYTTFCNQYQQAIEKKRAELTKKLKIPKEIDRGLRYYQRDNFRRHQKAGLERKKKLQAAIEITPNELQDLEEWERLGHDDEKDSALQKKLKEEEERYQVQAIAVDPMNPIELTHDEIEKLKIIFRMERKREIMAPDLHSSWAKWQPEKSTVKPEDLDLYLDHPKYNKAKKEWIDKWWEKRGNKKAYAGKVSQFESPKELEVYKEEAWLHNIPSRQSKLIIVERVKRGVTGYSKNDRDRMNRWEIQRHDHDRGSQFLFDLSTKRKEYEEKGVYTEREIDNLLWHHRVRRMDYELRSSKKRKKRAETETIQPHLIEFSDSEEKQWNGRNELQSLALSKLES